MIDPKLVDLAIAAADQIDLERPGLRQSGTRRYRDTYLGGRAVGEWIYTVVRRANRLQSTWEESFVLKATTWTHPVSYDTLGIVDPEGGFHAISLCRDGEGYPRRLINYGLVTNQVAFRIGVEPLPEVPTPEVPTPETPTPPYAPPPPLETPTPLDRRLVEAVERIADAVERMVLGE